MSEKLNGKQLYIPRDQDPVADLLELIRCIAHSDMKLVNDNDRMIWIDSNGKPFPVTVSILAEQIPQHVEVRKVVQRDGKLAVECQPFIATDTVLKALLTGTVPGRYYPGAEVPRLPGGGLLAWLPKV